MLSNIWTDAHHHSDPRRILLCKGYRACQGHHDESFPYGLVLC